MSPGAMLPRKGVGFTWPCVLVSWIHAVLLAYFVVYPRQDFFLRLHGTRKLLLGKAKDVGLPVTTMNYQKRSKQRVKPEPELV